MNDFDRHFDPVGEATDRYLHDCSEAEAQMDADEDEVYYHCTRCFVCGRKIMPRDTALTFDGGETYFCESHLEETDGRDIALDNGCDYDTMSRYMEATE